MTSRREVLQAGAVASVLAAGGLSRPAFAGGSANLRAVVYDSRFAEARAFARTAQGLGQPVRAIEGDVTRLWFQELQPAWRAAPAPVGGLTSVQALFCLERLAWDHGMRTVLRGGHVLAAGGEARLEAFGGARPERLARALESAGPEWPQLLAEAMVLSPAPVGEPRPEAASALAPSHGGPVLVSWIIAPVRRA